MPKSYFFAVEVKARKRRECHREDRAWRYDVRHIIGGRNKLVHFVGEAESGKLFECELAKYPQLLLYGRPKKQLLLDLRRGVDAIAKVTTDALDCEDLLEGQADQNSLEELGSREDGLTCSGTPHAPCGAHGLGRCDGGRQPFPLWCLVSRFHLSQAAKSVCVHLFEPRPFRFFCL